MGCFMQPIFRLLRKHRGEGRRPFGSGQKPSESAVWLWDTKHAGIVVFCEDSGNGREVPDLHWGNYETKVCRLCANIGGRSFQPQARCYAARGGMRKERGSHAISNGHYRNHRRQPERRLSGMLIPKMWLHGHLSDKTLFGNLASG